MTVMLSHDPADYRNGTPCDDQPGSAVRQRSHHLVAHWYRSGVDRRVPPCIDRLCFAVPELLDPAIHSLSMPRTRKTSLASANPCAIALALADVVPGAPLASATWSVIALAFAEAAAAVRAPAAAGSGGVGIVGVVVMAHPGYGLSCLEFEVRPPRTRSGNHRDGQHIECRRNHRAGSTARIGSWLQQVDEQLGGRGLSVPIGHTTL